MSPSLIPPGPAAKVVTDSVHKLSYTQASPLAAITRKIGHSRHVKGHVGNTPLTTTSPLIPTSHTLYEHPHCSTHASISLPFPMLDPVFRSDGPVYMKPELDDHENVACSGEVVGEGGEGSCRGRL